MIGGVASGFADYFDIDVVLVRVLLVFGFFFPIPFSIVIVYIICWIIMPDIAKKPKELPQSHYNPE